MDYVTVYSQDGRMLAALENADQVGYELKHNDLWTGSFSLPAGDPKNEYCQAHNLVRVPDGNRETGLYRIISMPQSEETAQGGLKTYNVEHVMATLLDDVLFGYHELGGVGITTRDVLSYILSHQTVVRWQLGECFREDQFQYHFENVSLLSALLSIGETIPVEYTWDFDTSTTPWTVNLRAADSEDGCGIHYRRNLIGIEKTMDASALVTRLYPLGYGEGVNQLTIQEANGGVPYIDADTAGIWGVKCSVWTDTRITSASFLLQRARQVLEGYKNPYLTYKASAVDLYNATGFSWDNYMPGKLVRVMDEEHGIKFSARIVSISKQDIYGDPGAMEITIANAPRDAADSINTLADRVGIGELYSQGATNLFALSFHDNADQDHPGTMRVYIPQGLVRINRMQLSWKAEAFRSFETGAEAGGGTTSTSSAGGGGSVTSDASDTLTETSAAGGGVTATIPAANYEPDTGKDLGYTDGPVVHGASEDTYSTQKVTSKQTNDSGQYIRNWETGSAGSHSHTVNSHSHGLGSHTHSLSDHTHSLNSHTHTVSSHSHSIGSHSHTLSMDNFELIDHMHRIDQSTVYSGYVENINNKKAKPTGSVGSASGDTGYSGASASAASGNTGSGGGGTTGTATGSTGTSSPGTDSQGSHTHTLGDHRHDMNHIHRIRLLRIPALSVTLPDHTHTFTIPAHSHSVSIGSHSHSVDIPAHTHDMIHGIYEGTTARTLRITVDGNVVPTNQAVSGDMDISAYLEKDQDGKITRGTWHEIEITPDQLTRIEANLFAQVFVQSVGGGNY